MSTYGDPTIDGNLFQNNSGLEAGGLHLHGGDGAALLNNVVISNTGHLAGGLYLHRASALLVNNVVADNEATGIASGLLVEQCSPRLVHTTIVHNIGGDGNGVYVRDGGGPFSSPVLTNTILGAHSVAISVAAGNTATLEATLWGSGAWANTTPAAGNVVSSTNLSGDPAFVDPARGDYHLGATSQAMDVGVDAGVAVDLDGQSRPTGEGYDIGADEFWWEVYLPLILRQ